MSLKHEKKKKPNIILLGKHKVLSSYLTSVEMCVVSLLPFNVYVFPKVGLMALNTS